MTNFCIGIFPLFGTLIGFIVSLLCCRILRRKMNRFLEFTQPKLNSSVDVLKFWHEKAIQEKMLFLIKDRLEAVVEGFKAEIPLASMFLGKAREDKLKEQAFLELSKIIPALQQLLEECVTSKDFYISMEQTALLAQQSLADLAEQLWRSMVMPVMVMGSLVGLLIGIIEMAIFSALCA